MSDKNELLKYLEQCSNEDDLNDIVVGFILGQKHNIPASSIMTLIQNLNGILHSKIDHLEVTQWTCYERGIYLRDYLEGKMWATEEAAKANLQPQINNARMIVDVCKG